MLGEPGTDALVTMSISPIGSASMSILAQPAAASAAQTAQANSVANNVQLALLQQEEQKGGGGGGGGGGHGVKKSGLEALSQIAAAVINKPKPASKTMQQRLDEIERMKREAAGEKKDEGDLADERDDDRSPSQEPNSY